MSLYDRLKSDSSLKIGSKLFGISKNIILNHSDSSIYSISVEFDSGECASFSKDGRYYIDCESEYIDIKIIE
jgi:hypothetical protein